MKLDKRDIKSSWSFILIVVGFIFIVMLTEEWILPVLQGVIKINHLNGIVWVALSAPLIWWFVKYRNRSQEELLENEERFRSVIQTANDAIILADNNGNIVSWNNCAQNMFGYESREILGKSLSILMPGEYGEAHRKILESNNSTEELKVIGKTIEASGRKKDGSDFPIEFSVSTWSTKHGRFYTGIIRDITLHKQAEDLLKKSKEFAETVLNNLDDTISIIDVKDFRILDVNKVFLEKYGVEKEEVIGKYCHEIIHKSAKRCGTPDEICPLLDTLNSGKNTTLEHIHYTGNGEKRFVTVSTSPIKDESGRVINVIHVVRDITKRKLAEEKIQASLKEKEILLREIHHRVKNNMQIISSLLGLASGTITDKQYVDMFRESQNRINSMSLVHENLYLSADLAKIDFNEYIKDLTSGLFHSHGVNAGTIELNLDIGNVSLGIDQAIPCGLIINELTTNSLKHAFPQGRKGEIKVSARHNDENMIEIVVSDNGVGILSDVDFRKTRSLGLHLVTILAENQLHGTISLDRSRGTEFKIIFNGNSSLQHV